MMMMMIFYHSFWLDFELFGLRVQVCSQLVQFTLVRKGYDNHHCHNKPQTENEAGVWMTSCPEEMGWEFGRFWKRFSWGPRPRCWEVGVRPGSWNFENGPWKTIVEFLPLGHRVGFRPLKDVVNIVWLGKTFKNCLFLPLLVSKNWTQKLIIKRSQKTPPVFISVHHQSYATLFVFDKNTWNHLTMCKQMSSGSSRNVIYEICFYKSYIFKIGIKRIWH